MTDDDFSILDGWDTDELWMLVAGGRDYGVAKRPEHEIDRKRAHAQRVYLMTYLDHVVSLRGTPARVIQGGAPGADTLAGVWASQRGYVGQKIGADWSRLGPAAGRKRNETMLTILKSRPGTRRLVVTFPTGGPGTKHMMSIAAAAGIEVIDATVTVL